MKIWIAEKGRVIRGDKTIGNNKSMKSSVQPLGLLTLSAVYLLIGLVALSRPYLPIDETRYIIVARGM